MPTTSKETSFTPTWPYQRLLADGDVSLTVTVDTTQADLTRVQATADYPDTMSESEVWLTLRQSISGKTADQAEIELVSLIAPGGYTDSFSKVTRFSSVLRALGYSSTTEITNPEPDIIRNDHSFTYPSIDRVNEVGEQLFPSRPLHFAPYPGNQYRASEFVRSFANEGRILVATEQPYQLHDHAVRHLLGWLAMSEDFVEPLREVLSQYMARAEAEALLPPIAALAVIKQEKFLRPAEAALKAAMRSMDFLTTYIAEELLMSDRSIFRTQEEGLAAILADFWRSAGNEQHVPSGFLGSPDYEVSQQAAWTMWQRYQAAEQAAAK